MASSTSQQRTLTFATALHVAKVLLCDTVDHTYPGREYAFYRRCGYGQIYVSQRVPWGLRGTTSGTHLLRVCTSAARSFNPNVLVLYETYV